MVITEGLNVFTRLKKLSFLELSPAAFVPMSEKFIFLFSFLFILLFFFPYPLLVFAFDFIDGSCLPGKPKEHSGTGLVVVTSRDLAFAMGSSFD